MLLLRMSRLDESVASVARLCGSDAVVATSDSWCCACDCCAEHGDVDGGSNASVREFWSE